MTRENQPLPAPAEARANAVITALRQQRDACANQLIDQFGETAALAAEWAIRWNDLDVLRARVAELEAAEVSAPAGMTASPT